MSNLQTYATADFSQVRLHAEPTIDTHGATKMYVDGEISSARADAADATSLLASNTTASFAAVDTALDSKFAKTGGNITGDVAVSGMVAIGDKWRVVAVGSSLEFQYSPDGEEWTVGIPFVSV